MSVFAVFLCGVVKDGKISQSGGKWNRQYCFGFRGFDSYDHRAETD